MSDGPFAETREQLGGYTLIEAEDLDEAIRSASGFLGEWPSRIEIRPVMELAGLPTHVTSAREKMFEDVDSAAPAST